MDEKVKRFNVEYRVTAVVEVPVKYIEEDLEMTGEWRQDECVDMIFHEHKNRLDGLVDDLDWYLEDCEEVGE